MNRYDDPPMVTMPATELRMAVANLDLTNEQKIKLLTHRLMLDAMTEAAGKALTFGRK